MKAAVCQEYGQPLVIEDLELDPPGPGEVGVGLAACAICHSDIHYIEGAWGGTVPVLCGHEAAGVVEEVGAGVESLAEGDHVVVTLIRSCGHCFHCAQGDPTQCETRFALDETSPLRRADGTPVRQGLRTGACSTRPSRPATAWSPSPTARAGASRSTRPGSRRPTTRSANGIERQGSVDPIHHDSRSRNPSRS